MLDVRVLLCFVVVCFVCFSSSVFLIFC
jgi:hypothetical protein